ncbi:solute carrier family 35 member G1-like [Lytechinus variegatus]|uniref:solute carrier family 35 member G1-like n=1 Tax=Lytechinus variegatus TaxID=7654 RepID=UPI001BB0E97C|nr:solute carrier family 35 member G1-like [Lytechinus variegatus]
MMLKGRQITSKRKHIDYREVDAEAGYHESSLTWRTLIRKAYRHRGIIWVVLSVCITAGFSLCIKFLEGSVPASQGLVIRGLVQVMFSLPPLVFHKVSLRFPLWVFLLIISRGLVGSLCFFLNYFAIQSLSVGTAKALAYSSPLFTGIFGRACLGERCSVPIVFFAFLTVIAVTLVVQPPFIFGAEVESYNAVGIICAIIGAVVLAANTIVLRFTQIFRVDVHAVIFVYGILSAVCGATTATVVGDWTNPQCGLDRTLVIGMAVTGFFEQLTVTLALKTETALVVSIIRTNEVFLCFALDVFIFGIVPNVWTIVGAILVVGSSIGMTISAHRMNKRRLKEREGDQK